MNLYKYVTYERIDVLENKLIRFTSPNDFNDPFEIKPYIKGMATAKNLEQKVFDSDKFIPDLQEGVFQKTGVKFPQKLLVNIFQEHKNGFLREYENIQKQLSNNTNSIFQEKIRNTIGILCLTETPYNLLMWSHYTDSHTGFVLTIDSCHRYFDTSLIRSEMHHLTKVIYRASRPNLYITDEEMFNLFVIKSKEWSYEQEWRLCKPLEKADKHISIQNSEIYLFEFPPLMIKEIILGCRISSENEEKIKNILSSDKSLQHVILKKAIPDDKEYKLNIVRMDN